ncbi:MAG: rRNA maturation RNase YbeY [Planctomycetota bacterium]
MKNTIHILCQVNSAHKYKKYIKEYTSFLLHNLKQKKDINIIITDNQEMAYIHKKFLSDSSPTDVISFHSYRIKNFLGEIIVNFNFAKRESKKQNISLKEELARYITHGVLHILGYKDSNPKLKKIMWEKQESILKEYYKRKKK